jgi:hypothetical protein
VTLDTSDAIGWCRNRSHTQWPGWNSSSGCWRSDFLFGGVVVEIEHSYSLRCFQSLCAYYNLVTYRQIIFIIKLPIKILSKFALYDKFIFPRNFESFSLKT